MTINAFLVIFFLIIPHSFPFILAVADPLYTFCSNDTRNYTLTSPFGNNLKLLLEALPSFTQLTGFNCTSIGKAPHEVYGQALCRGDVNSSAGQTCVKDASQEIFKACKSKEAILWYDKFTTRLRIFLPSMFARGSIQLGILRRKIY